MEYKKGAQTLRTGMRWKCPFCTYDNLQRKQIYDHVREVHPEVDINTVEPQPIGAERR
jgi:hypothetical protein